MAKIFVPGGAGYIGSHTVLDLLKQGHEVTVFDNLSNSSLKNLHQVEEMTGKKVEFIEGDLQNPADIAAALRAEHQAVIHFAALKSVVDSYNNPLSYYENNVGGTLNLLQAMQGKNVKNIIFSSTAAVYGQPDMLPITEETAVKPASVYGQTKAMIEQVFVDMLTQGLNSIRLRYFNVAGADKSGLIGEAPEAMGNLIPRLFKNLIGGHDLVVYGSTFPTKDGTQVRDYIHVSDLAAAHVLALDYLLKNPGTQVFNLGTGAGTTVLELINEVDTVTGRKIDFSFGEPRPGENIELYANAVKAKELLGWTTQNDYHQIIADTWNWYKSCPEYASIA